jgi:hypothetical protein
MGKRGYKKRSNGLNQASRGEVTDARVADARASVHDGIPLTPQEIGAVRTKIRECDQLRSAADRSDRDGGNRDNVDSYAAQVADLESMLAMNNELIQVELKRERYIQKCLAKEVLTAAQIEKLESHVETMGGLCVKLQKEVDAQVRKRELEKHHHNSFEGRQISSTLKRLHKRSKHFEELIETIRAKIAGNARAVAAYEERQAAEAAAREAAAAAAAEAEANRQPTPEEEFLSKVKAAGFKLKQMTADHAGEPYYMLVIKIDDRVSALLAHHEQESVTSLRIAGLSLCADESDIPTVHMSTKINSIAIPIGKNDVLGYTPYNWEMYEVIDQMLDLDFWPPEVADETSSDGEVDIGIDATVPTDGGAGVQAEGEINKPSRNASRNAKRRGPNGKGRGAARKGKKVASNLGGVPNVGTVNFE